MDEIEVDKQAEYLIYLFKDNRREMFVDLFLNSEKESQEYVISYILGSHDAIKQALNDCMKLMKGEDIG